MGSRQGIICAGNWIVDIIQFIDCWPKEGELAAITEEMLSLGGCSANVSIDLIKLDPTFPVLPIGCIGNDEYGELILETCAKYQLPTRYFHRIPNERTAHTQVINTRQSGQRTFFHYKGASSMLDNVHVPLEEPDFQKYKHFHLGYLLLLDKLDEIYSDGTTGASRLLQRAKEAGFTTSIDVVSENSTRFTQVIPPALPHVDYLIINELEASRITNIPLTDKNEKALYDVGQRLIELGVKNAIIHAPFGALWAEKNSKLWVGNDPLGPQDIVSSVGAGDAFCAMTLYGIHQAFPIEKILKLAHAVAKQCILGSGATDNIPQWGQL